MKRPVSQAITNLQNGISQQTPALRYTSQCEEQENCRNDPVVGMGKRFNSVLTGRILGVNNPEEYLIETIERDEFERYKFFIKSGTVKVFDAESGVEYPTNVTPSVLPYLTIQGAKRSSQAFQLLNTIDTTFLLNRTVPVKRLVSNVVPRVPEALWYIKQADYKTKYKVIPRFPH